MKGLIIHKCESCEKARSGCTDLTEGERITFCIECYFLQFEGKCPKGKGRESFNGECPECHELHNSIPDESNRSPVVLRKKTTKRKESKESSLRKGGILCPSGRRDKWTLQL